MPIISKKEGHKEYINRLVIKAYETTPARVISKKAALIACEMAQKEALKAVVPKAIESAIQTFKIKAIEALEELKTGYIFHDIADSRTDKAINALKNI